MEDKKQGRQRRARRARAHIRNLQAHRLTVHRTPRHIYAQIIGPSQDVTLVSASTAEKDIAGSLSGTGNIDAARRIGQTIAERAKAAGITAVAFDRSGFKYHGRIKALADAAREAGLEF